MLVSGVEGMAVVGVGGTVADIGTPLTSCRESLRPSAMGWASAAFSARSACLLKAVGRRTIVWIFGCFGEDGALLRASLGRSGAGMFSLSFCEEPFLSSSSVTLLFPGSNSVGYGTYEEGVR